MRRLAGETALYGLPGIVGRFLNWLLVPLYVRVLPGAADFGVYTNLYGWTALLLVILTYGMETGFFRFINKDDVIQPMRVYATTLWALVGTSTLFIILALTNVRYIADLLGYGEHPDYVALLILVVALDAISAIPFAYLRYRRKALRFALLRTLSIALNIVLNLIFFLLLPSPGYGVGYIFLANLITTLVTLLLLLPQILPACRYPLDLKLLRRMLAYTVPILFLGIAGIFNQAADKILFPMLFADKAQAAEQLGIYGACFKIAAVMVMFTQAFRYAYEPLIFACRTTVPTPVSTTGDTSSGSTTNRTTAVPTGGAAVDAMKYFIYAALFLFLFVTLYIDLWKHLITPAYYSGLRIIPIVLLGEILFGIYFNLSFWYKLTDRTYWGAIISAIGCTATVAIIILFAPKYGFIACAWATPVSNG
ncbi:MAG: oligosaccharide flippase family protein, partial [Tannerellaceae bacterium]|nr:oligosaccharide flippase family protein [Tannerellaceae bacterium]